MDCFEMPVIGKKVQKKATCGAKLSSTVLTRFGTPYRSKLNKNVRNGPLYSHNKDELDNLPLLK
jgi:hypothetical protein